MGGPVVQWVEQKSPCQPASSHLASKISALNGVGEGGPKWVKNESKKSFEEKTLFLRERAGLGNLLAPLLSDFAEGPRRH